MSLRNRLIAFFERENAFDRIAMRLWPSTRGELEYPIYAQSIAHLYQSPASVATGSAVITVLFILAIATRPIPPGSVALFAIFVPISTLRYLQLRFFNSLPKELRLANAERRETRYVMSAMAIVITVAALTASFIPALSYNEKLTVSLVMAAYSAGLASRNASHPRLVLAMTTTLVLPLFAGMITDRTPTATVVAALLIVYCLTITKTSHAILSHLLDALRHARAAERLATYDPVTQLPNRSHFMSRLTEALVSAPDTCFSLLTLDLDRFKQVNDTRGHAVGDQLLIQAAHRIVETAHGIDPNAVISRFGGDEFVILTTSDFDESLATAAIAALRRPFSIGIDTLNIGASVGVCRRNLLITASDLFRQSDIALYEAKETGRNRYCLFNEDLGARAQRRALTEERFQDAVENGALSLAFQPIVDIETAQVVAAEALARWTDPELGTVSPTTFIKIAEQTGLITRVSEILLTKACHSAMAWPTPIPVAFNVSAQQLQTGQALISQVERALKESGLPPNRLELEITESTLIKNFDEVAPTISALRSLGVRIALDDFGSGYCSLIYLNKIAFDKIKIDQELAAQASRSKTQATIIRMIAAIGADLGADVVVEGIEDAGTALHMRHLGIRLAQGYFYGRPASTRIIAKHLDAGVVDGHAALPNFLEKSAS